jgi:hypothetical protein
MGALRPDPSALLICDRQFAHDESGNAVDGPGAMVHRC